MVLSASETCGVAVHTVMPLPTWAGVLGIERTIFSCPKALRIVLMRIPAMILISSVSGWSRPLNSAATLSITCGFTARTTTRAPSTAALLSGVTWMLCC